MEGAALVLHGEWAEIEIAGRRVAMTHYPLYGQALARTLVPQRPAVRQRRRGVRGRLLVGADAGRDDRAPDPIGDPQRSPPNEPGDATSARVGRVWGASSAGVASPGPPLES